MARTFYGAFPEYVSAAEGSANRTYAVVTARSYHSGVIHILLMDGSARAASTNISGTTWKALGTRSEGEVVDEY